MQKQFSCKICNVICKRLNLETWALTLESIIEPANSCQNGESTQ